VNVERKVRTWLEEVRGAPLPSADFMAALKDGVVLCELLNKLYTKKPPVPPGAIYRGTVAFPQMQNINSYLEACKRPPISMSGLQLFETSDLFKGKDAGAVLTHLTQLATELGKRKDYRGPKLEDISQEKSLFAATYVTFLCNFMRKKNSKIIFFFCFAFVVWLMKSKHWEDYYARVKERHLVKKMSRYIIHLNYYHLALRVKDV
jgi:hypothetical protein